MFDKYPYKTKFKALLLIFCLLSITAYKRSFSTLKDVVKENSELSKKEKTLKDGTKDVKKLSAQIAAIDKIIGKENINKEKIQQDMISFITKYPVSIFDMKPIHEFTDDSHTIYTHEIDVTGNLNQLLLLSYDLEKKFNYSRMISEKFYTSKKDNKSDILHFKMIFQNYENNK
jgi:hypothetical protein